MPTKTVSKPRTTNRTIWTWGYRPFIMGGDVNYVLACKVPCTGPFKVGRGYEVYVATAPNGTTFVAEAQSGAIVGGSLEQVREDIRTGDPKMMQKQVTEALESAKKAEIKSPDFFWGALKCKAD